LLDHVRRYAHIGCDIKDRSRSSGSCDFEICWHASTITGKMIALGRCTLQAMISHTLGAVLAGGRSTRMGMPKEDLTYLGVPFLDHAVATLSLVVSDVVVCGSTAATTVPVVADAVVNGGPLSGIVAALRHADGRPVAVLAVDLPLVTVSLVERLVVPAVAGSAIRLATDGDHIQPLCAVFGPGTAPKIETYLETGARSVLTFVDGVALVERIMTDPYTLTNVNTPGEYAALPDGGHT
jgi:molybdopterin-guanine dinucleotide biosynthesis protein A